MIKGSLKKSIINKKYVIGAILLGFVALNISSNFAFSGIGLDFTQDKLFSLSKPTKNVLKSIKEPIYFDFYFSKTAATQDPPLRNYASFVRNILKTYEHASGSKIKFREIDVKQFTDIEDKAIENGLSPYNDNQNVEEPIYFGLIATSGKKKAVIPFFDENHQQSLEYDLTRLISDFSNDNNKEIAIITGLPWLIDNGQPKSEIIKTIADNYRLINLTKDFNNIDANIKTLIIAEPWDLSDIQLMAIDQFLQRGGKLLLALDPATSISKDNNQGETTTYPKLSALMANYGLGISNDVVLDKKGALPVKIKLDNKEIVAPQPLYFNIPQSGLNEKNKISEGFTRGLNFASSGYLDTTNRPNISFEPLAKTSKDTEIINKIRALGSPDPQTLIQDWNSTNNQFTISALVKGKAQSAFANAPIKYSTKPFEIIAFSDVDFLSDGLYLDQNQKAADNSDFIMNAINELSGDEALIGLRAKSSHDRSFSVVNDIKAKAQENILIKQSQIQQQLSEYNQSIENIQKNNTNAQAANVKQLKNKITKTRKELRDLQSGVKNGTDAIKNTIIGICAFIIPAIFLAFGIILSLKRKAVQSLIE